MNLDGNRVGFGKMEWCQWATAGRRNSCATCNTSVIHLDSFITEPCRKRKTIIVVGKYIWSYWKA